MRFAIVAGLVAIPAAAIAGDDGTAPLNPLDPVQVISPVSVVQGDGVKIGEGTSIYPQIGLETGFVSNVFYTHDNPVGSGLLRVIAEVGAGSLSPQRRRPPIVDEARANWLRQYAERGGYDLSASYGYGDSHADLVWLELVGHPHAVNPDSRLAREAGRRRWRIDTWKSGSRTANRDLMREDPADAIPEEGAGG